MSLVVNPLLSHLPSHHLNHPQMDHQVYHRLIHHPSTLCTVLFGLIYQQLLFHRAQSHLVCHRAVHYQVYHQRQKKLLKLLQSMHYMDQLRLSYQRLATNRVSSHRACHQEAAFPAASRPTLHLTRIFQQILLRSTQCKDRQIFSYHLLAANPAQSHLIYRREVHSQVYHQQHKQLRKIPQSMHYMGQLKLSYQLLAMNPVQNHQVYHQEVAFPAASPQTPHQTQISKTQTRQALHQ